MRKKSLIIAFCSFIIPGVGQFLNKQLLKAIFFLFIDFCFILFSFFVGFSAIRGLVTLGDIAKEDNSMYLLVQGTLALIVYLIFLVVYLINIYDAYKVARKRGQGISVPKTGKEFAKKIYENGFPYLITIPAYLLMAFVIIFPVLVTIFIAFTNYDLKHTPPSNLIDWVGVGNFVKIFFRGSFQEAFVGVFSWTIIWTFSATTASILLGIFVAVITNQPWIKGQRFFRTIFLLPWAVPAFVTILTFSNMFNDSYGAMNQQVIALINQLPFIEIATIPWKTNPNWTKFAMIMIQTWLGFPFIYVMITGVLQSIPGDLYEAARIDGANALKRFQKITLPMILFTTAPVLITQYTFNFNNFSLIYLFNQGGPGTAAGGAGTTDILISWVYKLTTSANADYALAAAVTLIISSGLIIVALTSFKFTKSFDKEDMM